MAFCNSCGASLALGAQFCNKCGAAVASASSAASTDPTSPAPAPKGGSSALKIVLIVVGVIVVIGILGVAAISFVVLHIAKSSHVQQQGDHVKIETPFGTISANDSDQAIKDLCVDVYPGAQPQKQGTADLTIGPVHTVVVNFESSDSVDQVCTFYKSKIPGATVKTSDEKHCSVVSKEPGRVVTINIDGSSNTTKFQTSCVIKPSGDN